MVAKLPLPLPFEDPRADQRLSPNERGRRLVACLRLAEAIVKARPDRARVLAARAPLPESTIRALARLRADYAARSKRRPT